MPFLSKDQTYERFRKAGQNSSHFVWLLDELTYFESSNGWVFGYRQIGDVTLLALEPLIPGAPTRYDERSKRDFDTAWEEFRSAVRPRISAFVSVYAPFVDLLRAAGFSSFKIGKEPWIDLDHYIPRGNAGKGVRSARNQALRSGLKVEEWPSDELSLNEEKKSTLRKIASYWKSTRVLHLDSFLNSVDPFAYPRSRRYFVLKDQKEVVRGYLVATEIPGIRSYFLEDLLMGKLAPKGAGELLTLEAMRHLQESGVTTASLGVVSVTHADASLKSASDDLPPLIRTLVTKIPRVAAQIYNFDGLEVFRKRFNPNEWKDVHLAVKNEADSGHADTWAWLLSLGALLWAFRPRIRISWAWFARQFGGPFRSHPVTIGVGAISLALFAEINRFGRLPDWALTRFGFANNAPLLEWPLRSVVSDFLYFDRTHFIFCVVPLLAVIWWTERSHKLSFVLPFVAMVCLFDDFFNFIFVVKPFHYFQPEFYLRLVDEKDVGGSLWLATLLGLQICQIRRNREVLFASLCVISVFGIVYNSDHLKTLILNLNHFLFLSIGYITGKILFEMERIESRRVSKHKPPEAACVLPADSAAENSERRQEGRNDRRKSDRRRTPPTLT